MVNTINVSRYKGTPPTASSARVKIPGGPLYAADEVIAILQTTTPRLWTRKCVGDAQRLGLTDEDVGALIGEALQKGRYKDSEWCEQKPGGPVAACDSYVICRMEWNEDAYKYLSCEYYLKFAIGITGQIVLTISCHT